MLGGLGGLLGGMMTSGRGGGGGGRRSGCGGKALGGGIGAVVIIVLVVLLGGGNMGDVLGSLLGGGGTGLNLTEQTYTPSAEEDELAEFSKKIFAGTEDVWTEIFRQNGLTYEPPTLVLYSGSTTSGCGNASASTGPFYCSADQSVYIDLSFFQNMRKTLGADGDFAYAYVIAHEVGHHVQYLLGTLDKAHEQMSRLSETEANKISVRLELQADFYAGVWANRDNARFNSLETGDIEEALDAASKIGDDYLQRKAYGREIPDSFNHGRSEQRVRWLTKGLNTGDPLQGDTFEIPYSQL